MTDLDLEIARAVERALLGAHHPLACGCVLEVTCRMPGPEGYIRIPIIGHKLCVQHYDFSLYKRANKSLEAFSNWYRPTPHWFPEPVNMAQFQAAFDVCFKETPRAFATHVSDRWILSADEVSRIYRTGLTNSEVPDG